jgi:hypothetical protein
VTPEHVKGGAAAMLLVMSKSVEVGVESHGIIFPCEYRDYLDISKYKIYLNTVFATAFFQFPKKISRARRRTPEKPERKKFRP